MTAVIILKDVPEPTPLCININLRWSLLYILRLINKKLDEGFVISGITGVEVSVISRAGPRQIALNKTLIIRISQKLNLIIILLFYYKNKCLEENNKIHLIARNLT